MGRDKAWTDAGQRDLEDYEHWRRFATEKDARQSNVHWLTPRAWRRWIDIGPAPLRQTIASKNKELTQPRAD